MFCESCGNQLPDNAKFCTACGATTGRSQAAPAQPAYTPPPTQPAYTPPPPPAQPAYTHSAAPAQPAYAPMAALDAPLGVGQYIGMFFLLAVPILNIILLFKWAFGSSANLNKKNYARAALILAAVGLIFSILAGGFIAEIFEELMYSFY
ncbi:MAG: zinc ribbon domain-containing protein [Clostridia bacterium]|nr:zinc ribbon domain-containing protein [Clostridia bacterium]NCC75753.1 zinc ribbon domain-containing protein [Clostridia bacterium]